MTSNQTPPADVPPERDEAAQGPSPSTQSDSYTQHRISAAFPPMSDVEFTALVEDIKARGLRLPITLYEGQILDGWHRYRACRGLGLKPATADFTGTIEAAVAFAFSLNARRRHLDTGQLALLTAEHFLPRFETEALARQRAGKTAVSEALSASGRTGGRHKQPAAVEAGKAVGVSARSVERAKYVLMHGTAEDVAALRSGSRKLAGIAKAVRQRTDAKNTTATKPSTTGATAGKAITATTTTAPAPMSESAALTPPDAATIAALEALDEALKKHLVGWPGDPELFIECLRKWELETRRRFGLPSAHE